MDIVAVLLSWVSAGVWVVANYLLGRMVAKPPSGPRRERKWYDVPWLLVLFTLGAAMLAGIFNLLEPRWYQLAYAIPAFVVGYVVSRFGKKR